MVHGIDNINQYINLNDIKRFLESMTENQVVKYSVGIISIILCIGIFNYHYSNNGQVKSKKKKREKSKNKHVNDENGNIYNSLNLK